MRRAARYGRIWRVGDRRCIELIVTCWYVEAGLTESGRRRSLKVLSSLIACAPITCGSLSRASAHVVAPVCDVGRAIAATFLAFPIWRASQSMMSTVHCSPPQPTKAPVNPSSLSPVFNSNSDRVQEEEPGMHCFAEVLSTRWGSRRPGASLASACRVTRRMRRHE